MNLLFLFSLLPAFLTGTHSSTENLSIKTDFYEDFVSIDDVFYALNGDISFDEEVGTYTYTLNNHEIILNLEHGYSQVNGQKEPLYINIDEETGLKTITWTKPQLIEEEIFVPIQFIERIFDTTATEDGFELTISIDEEETEDEEIEEVIEEAEEEVTSSNALQLDKKDEVINQVSTKPAEQPAKPNYVQQPTTPSVKPSQPVAPQTPSVTPSKPTPTPEPEEKPEIKPEVKPEPSPEPDLPPKEEEGGEEIQPPVNEDVILPDNSDSEETIESEE